MNHYGWTFGPSGGGLTIRPGSRPVYFADPSDPTMKIVCKNDFGSGSCTGANGVNVAGRQINVPRGAAPQSGSDAHLTVIETATGAEYDFWDASIQGSTIVAGDGSSSMSTRATGLGANGDAANFALTAGLLRPSELASGEIDHALAVTVPCTSGNGANVGYSWPASGGWGEACGDYWNESTSGAPGLGQLLRLNMTDQQIAGSSAPTWEKTIMTALSHYGAYIEDTDGSYNSGIGIIVQDPASWTDLGAPDEWASTLQQFGDSSAGGTLSSHVPIPVSDLQVVNACVPQGTCAGGSASSPQHPSGAAGDNAREEAQRSTEKHTKHRRHAHHHKRHRHHRKHTEAQASLSRTPRSAPGRRPVPVEQAVAQPRAVGHGDRAVRGGPGADRARRRTIPAWPARRRAAGRSRPRSAAPRRSRAVRRASRRGRPRSPRRGPASRRRASRRCRRSVRPSGRPGRRRRRSSAPGSIADSSSASGTAVSLAQLPRARRVRGPAPRRARSRSAPAPAAWRPPRRRSQAPLASIRIASCGPPNARTAATRPASSPIPTFSLTVREPGDARLRRFLRRAGSIRRGDRPVDLDPAPARGAPPSRRQIGWRAPRPARSQSARSIAASAGATVVTSAQRATTSATGAWPG